MCLLGTDLLKNDPKALLLIVVTKAFGGEQSGFIYVSPSSVRSTKRPPDIVLCHTAVGLLIIEAKGHPISEIKEIEAGNMLVWYENRAQPASIIRQLEDQMYEIESDILKVVRTYFRHNQQVVELAFNVLLGPKAPRSSSR